jgi:hypothetical protein
MNKSEMKAEIEAANIGEPLRAALIELIEKEDSEPSEPRTGRRK